MPAPSPPWMLTRDSWFLVVTALASVVAYLITNEKPPTEWTYREWLNALSVFCVWASGQLSQSRLAASTTDPKDSRSALGGFISLTTKR